MANGMNQDITGKYIILRKSAMAPAYQDMTWRVFYALGGFGCLPDTMGNGVFGWYVRDKEEARVEGYDVERFATEEEIKMAQDAPSEAEVN